jgi:PTS system mannose-specific IID component
MKLTKRDINRSFNRWWYSNEIPNNLDYLLGPSLLYALLPSLRKLYTDNEDLKEAYLRHLTYFNTQAIWGGATITGIVSNLEELKSNQLNRTIETNETEITETFINMTKTGLMGVLAGVGDAVDSGTVQYIFITLALPWAFNGYFIGALMPWIAFVLSTYTYGNYFAYLGYIKGRMAAVELVSSKKFQMLTEIVSLLGLILLGYIGANTIQIELNQNRIELLSHLNETNVQLIEGFLGLGLILVVYYYLSKKGLDLLKGLIFISLIVCALIVIGIL